MIRNLLLPLAVLAAMASPVHAGVNLMCEGEGVEADFPMGGGTGFSLLSASVWLGDKESRRGVGPFLPGDRRTLGLFANQAAIALENARLHLRALEQERLEREMHLAAEIQRQILPKGAPQVPGYQLAGYFSAGR